MITGILDTSDRAAFAVHDGSGFLFNGSRDIGGRRGDEVLVPWILDVLGGLGLAPGGVARWIVGTGPGSFTGTRVGIAFVQGVCAVSGAPVCGIPGSLALARSVCREAGIPSRGCVVVLHDARRAQVIASAYERSGETFRPASEARVVQPADLDSEYPACVAFVTPHADPVAELVPPEVRARLLVREGLDASLLADPPGYPLPADPGARVASLEPVYVRPAVFVKPSLPTAFGRTATPAEGTCP